LKNKSISMIILLVVLLVFSVGCTGKEAASITEAPKEVATTTQSKTDNIAEEETKQDKQETEPAQTEAEAQKTEKAQSTEKQESEDITTALDPSLKDKALVDSLKGDRPKTMKMESEMIAYGMTSQILTYYDDSKTRTETSIPQAGKSISIFLEDEGVMYSYVEGDSDGTKMIGANSDLAEEMGLRIDNTDLLAALVEGSSEALSARVETLNGEEVVYIEATELDDEVGEVFVQMWYSVKYNTPMKYKMSIGEKTMMELIVTHVEKDVTLDKSLFLPPDNVNFREMDAEAMMNDW
jgi:outer membrane lipoprotein-sorting protein